MLYRAAEFTRDTDIAILACPENLDRLRKGLADLQAEAVTIQLSGSGPHPNPLPEGEGAIERFLEFIER